MSVTREYDYSAYTPIDSSLTQYNIFKSAYRNIRFGVQTSQKVTLTTAEAANLPGLSYRLYGTPNLWRALLALNGLNDPISDVVVGLTLNVPSKADLTAYLSKQQNNSNPTLTI